MQSSLCTVSVVLLADFKSRIMAETLATGVCYPSCDSLSVSFSIPLSDGREEQTVTRASWAGWAKVAADYEESWDLARSRGWTGSEDCSSDKGNAMKQLVSLDILIEMTSDLHGIYRFSLGFRKLSLFCLYYIGLLLRWVFRIIDLVYDDMNDLVMNVIWYLCLFKQ